MYRFDRIGGVDHLADRFRVAEIRQQILPLAAPGLDHDRVLVAPGPDPARPMPIRRRIY